jgi:hypothetical protein
VTATTFIDQRTHNVPGYPAADEWVEEFCTRADVKLLGEVEILFLCFFEAVFDATSQKLDEIPHGDPSSNFPLEWREKLGTVTSGARNELYRTAVNKARAKVSHGDLAHAFL